MEHLPDLPRDSAVTVRDDPVTGALEVVIPTQKWDHLRNAVLAIVLGALLLAYFHEELLLFATSNTQDASAAELGVGGSIILGILLLLLMKRAGAIAQVFRKFFSARRYGLVLRIAPEGLEIGSDEEKKTFEAMRIPLDRVATVEVGRRQTGDFIYGNRTDHLVRLRHGARSPCIAMPSLEEANWLQSLLRGRLGIAAGDEEVEAPERRVAAG